MYAIANKFCANRGIALETVKFTMVNSGFARPGSVALQFRCVPKSAPAASPGTCAPSTAVEMRLHALNDLKTRGLITEEEYQKKRAEILGAL